MTEELKLRECPFCGNANLDVEPWHGGAPTKHRIGCHDDACDVRPGICGETLAEAIAAWNTRAHSAELTQLVKAAREVSNTFEAAAYEDDHCDAIALLRTALVPFKEVE